MPIVASAGCGWRSGRKSPSAGSSAAASLLGREPRPPVRGCLLPRTRDGALAVLPRTRVARSGQPRRSRAGDAPPRLHRVLVGVLVCRSRRRRRAQATLAARHATRTSRRSRWGCAPAASTRARLTASPAPGRSRPSARSAATGCSAPARAPGSVRLGRHPLGSRPSAAGRWAGTRLRSSSCSPGTGFPSATVDGEFGSHSVAALEKFERWAGLPVDGVAGLGGHRRAPAAAADLPDRAAAAARRPRTAIASARAATASTPASTSPPPRARRSAPPRPAASSGPARWPAAGATW